MEGPDKLLGEWVRATWSGWILGLLLTIVAALAGDVVGIGGSQALVGAGMGAGVGIMQGRAVRRILSDSRAWAYSSVVGIAAPFLVFDVSRAAGLQLPYSLYVCVALGGLAAGLWQAILLSPHVAKAWMWVLGSVAGWSLAALSAAVADYLPRALSVRGVAGAAIYLAAALAGGLILGLATGLLLVRLRPAAPDSDAARA